MSFSYPVVLDLFRKSCLVIGTAEPAAEKVSQLIEAGAQVTVLSSQLPPPLQLMLKQERFRWIPHDWSAGDLTKGKYFLAVVCRPTREGNEDIWREAEENGVLLNAIDDPAHCRFAFPSIHRQGELTVAISTNGQCPALAVRVRERISREIGPEYGAFVGLARELREEIAARVPEFNRRRELWYRLVDSEALELLRQGQTEQARQRLREILEA
jgi:siroheme synthase-like protein